MRTNNIMLVFIILLVPSCLTDAQKYVKNPQIKQPQRMKCSEVIKYVSYFWKKDSSADNGYRNEVVRLFRPCEIDSVSYNFVLEKLGKSGVIANSDIEGFSLIYSHLRVSDKDNSKRLIADNKIVFRFDKDTKLLIRIK